MSITMYGIANCDTIRKARKWLDNHGIDYRLHDYRKDGLTREMLISFIERLGWEALLNRRGTTWRKLPAQIRDNIDRNSAIEVMLEQPAIIKRPLLERDDGELQCGFSADGYKAFLLQQAG